MAYQYHPTINTTPTTPSFPSFPWKLFSPHYTNPCVTTPYLYFNHGYTPPPPNLYSSYSSSHYSYYYNNYHQQLSPTKTSYTIRRDFEKHLQVSHINFKKNSKTKTYPKFPFPPPLLPPQQQPPPPPQLQLQPNRPSISCDIHPQETFTGFCPSCLCEHLAVLDPNNNNASSSSTSKRKIPKTEPPRLLPELDTRNLASSSTVQQSFIESEEDEEEDNIVLEEDSDEDEIRVLEPPQPLQQRERELSNMIEESFHKIVEEEPDFQLEPEPELVFAKEESLKPMKEHMDLDSQAKKSSGRDLKEIAGSFWSAASVFSKKLQKWRQKQKAERGQFDILFMTPEKACTIPTSFWSNLLKEGISLFAVDEAHCISEWGHDFRVEYKQLDKLRGFLLDVPYVGLTATATEKVRFDITNSLKMNNPYIVVGSFDRQNLFYGVKQFNRGQYFIDELVEEISKEVANGCSTIIYCTTIKDVEQIYKSLMEVGINAGMYHGQMDGKSREESHRLFIRDGIASACWLYYTRSDFSKGDFYATDLKSENQKKAVMESLLEAPLYCLTATCRRKFLLEHFGEKFAAAVVAEMDELKPVSNAKVFVRDFVPSALVFLMSKDHDIVKNFLEITLLLQSREKIIDRFCLSAGVIPSSFKVKREPGKNSESMDPDFGGSAIGKVAPVDSGFWWIILLRAYTKSTGDNALADSAACQEGMRLILDLCLSEGFDTFPTLLCADGCCMIDRRMGLYGYPIEIQALFYMALRCAMYLLKQDNEGKKFMERIVRRMTALSFPLRSYFWLDLKQLNDVYRYKTEEYSHTAVNKFNVIPDSLPDWVFDFMPHHGGYFIENVSPSRMDFRWFCLGSCIAILSCLATSEQSTAIMDLIESRWDALIGEMPAKICYPALENHEWKEIEFQEYTYSAKGQPLEGGSFHPLLKVRCQIIQYIVGAFMGALSRTLNKLQSKQIDGPLHSGMISGSGSTLFEEFGLCYIGPLDGHDIDAASMELSISKVVRYRAEIEWYIRWRDVGMRAASGNFLATKRRGIVGSVDTSVAESKKKTILIHSTEQLEKYIKIVHPCSPQIGGLPYKQWDPGGCFLERLHV